MADRSTYVRATLLASTIVLVGATHASALGWFPRDRDNEPKSHSTPGPVVGVGVPAALLIGSFIWYRRRAAKKN